MPERTTISIATGVSSTSGATVIVVCRLCAGRTGLKIRGVPTVPKPCDRTVLSCSAYSAGAMLGTGAGTGRVCIGYPIAVGVRCHRNAHGACSCRAIRFSAMETLAAHGGAGRLDINRVSDRVIVISDRHRDRLCRRQIVHCSGDRYRHET